jgi:hypothetical protein
MVSGLHAGLLHAGSMSLGSVPWNSARECPCNGHLRIEVCSILGELTH